MSKDNSGTIIDSFKEKYGIDLKNRSLDKLLTFAFVENEFVTNIIGLLNDYEEDYKYRPPYNRQKVIDELNKNLKKAIKWVIRDESKDPKFYTLENVESEQADTFREMIDQAKAWPDLDAFFEI